MSLQPSWIISSDLPNFKLENFYSIYNMYLLLEYRSYAHHDAQWAKIAILVSLVKIFLVNHKNILIHLLYIFSKIFGYNQISSLLQNLKCQYLLNEKS